MSITTYFDVGDRNGGGDPTVITQDAISITQTQDGGGNNRLTLQASLAARHTAETAGVNGAWGGVKIKNTEHMGYLTTVHTGQLLLAMGVITTAITKANTPDKQQALMTILHQFLTDGNIIF